MHENLELLSTRAKSSNTVDFEQQRFEICFYEEVRWVYEVSQRYVDRILELGVRNDDGVPRQNLPVDITEKRQELERLETFVDENDIPLFKLKKSGIPIEPRVLSGEKRRKEVQNILNRFDAACYRHLARGIASHSTSRARG